jgi:hypothetical protein
MIIYVVIYFWIPSQKREKKKIVGRKKNIYIYSSEKRTHEHLENAQGLVEKVQKIQRLKLDDIFLTDKVLIDKENLI